MAEHDHYEGLDYRGMIRWSARLEREWPLYVHAFDGVRPRALLDLGCGPGEHSARFARDGWATTGIDASSAQVDDARRHHPGLEFVQADLGDFAGRLERGYGAALCVGNVLPNLDDATFDAMLDQLARLLVTGGRVLLQQLEFGPILAGERRSIGPMFRAADGDRPESAFLRIFCPAADRRFVDFLPTRFTLHPGEETPVRIETSSSVQWRARTREEVEAALLGHGFTVDAVWGSVERAPHDAVAGQDLWVLATRSGS